ncbi:MAG: FAD-binding domain-containing protein, partial [Bosea sp. (in: a-proteobacteria)]
IHWPQVQMQSGLTGINVPRIYNPLKHSLDQDPPGRFIRAHVPEIAALPNAFLHAPWTMDMTTQEANNIVLGRDYPERIVDHEVAARAARERLTALRRTPDYQAAARGVYAKHGSRKRRASNNKPASTRAINARKAKSVTKQLSLDL